jgi:hypothetical protein
MPAEDPPASAAPPPVRVTTPRELLSAVPALLGFYPRACVVVIGVMPPRGSVRVSLRFAGYDPAGPGAAALGARFAVALLASGQCPRAAAVGYGPDQHVAPFFALLREQAARLGIELTELLRAEDGRYWSCARTGPSCCPPGGSPYGATPDPALAAFLPEGVPAVLPGREALAGLVAPCGGEQAALVTRAVRAAGRRAARLTGRARQSAVPVTRRHPLAGAGIRAVRAALRACRQGQVITSTQAGWLLVALGDSWVRDDALGRLDPASRRADLRLWTDLTRLAAPGYVAAPATLLAHAAWRAGNGALANVALDRALDDDPGYPLARTMQRVLALGAPPAKAEPPMTPRQVALFYRARATGAGRPALTARREAADGYLSA